MRRKQALPVLCNPSQSRLVRASSNCKPIWLSRRFFPRSSYIPEHSRQFSYSHFRRARHDSHIDRVHTTDWMQHKSGPGSITVQGHAQSECSSSHIAFHAFASRRLRPRAMIAKIIVRSSLSEVRIPRRLLYPGVRHISQQTWTTTRNSSRISAPRAYGIFHGAFRCNCLRMLQFFVYTHHYHSSGYV